MKRVLFLDDDESVLDVVQEALVHEGFDVKIITGTDDILSEIDEYRPDVVVIDYILVGINGGEICHQIKANTKTADIPVVLVSAYPQVLMSLGTYGCDEFVPKPFDLDDFAGRIKKLTERKEGENLHV
jgi:DNA-binding response OmpR family regulator